MKIKLLCAGASVSLASLVFLAGSAAAATLYVDVASGTDVGVCGSLATPCASIQRAVNLAANGDSVLIAAGTYTYQASQDPCAADQTGVVCIFNRSLDLEGGHLAGDWSLSDPANFPTVIDGEDQYRGVLILGSGNNDDVVMEGFTVRRGLGNAANADAAGNAFGGGISVVLADLDLRHSILEDNTVVGENRGSGAGGAGAGGGLAIRSNASSPLATLNLENVKFEGNQAMGGTGPGRGGYGEGGGLWIFFTVATANGLEVRQNMALGGSSNGTGTTGGKADAQGGGIAFKQSSDSVFQRLVVVDNEAHGGIANAISGFAGGAFGGGLYGEGATSIVVRDSLVRGNLAMGANADQGGLAFGGGMMALDSTVLVERVEILENTAQGGDGPTRKGSGGGGGAYYSDNDGASGSRTITLVNTVLGGNHVALGTGGGSVGGGGGGLFLNGSQATLEHSTLASNSLSPSPPLIGWAIVAITRLPGPNQVPSSLVFRDGIIAHHADTSDAAVHVQAATSAVFDEGLFAANNTDTAGAGSYSGLGSMASSASADFRSIGAPNHDYHIKASSPAAGAATGSTEVLDLDGETRSAPRDWGADESSSLIFGDGFEGGNTAFWSSTSS